MEFARTRTIIGTALTAIAATLVVAAAQNKRVSADWPQWRGPDRTGVSKETGLLKSWPADGPRLLWQVEALGYGISTPSIAGGRVYGMSLRGDDEVVWALNAADGKEVWCATIGKPNNNDPGRRGAGPRCTPTIDGDGLYALGVNGDFACLDLATGKPRWQKSLVRDFGGNMPGWGYSESPLIDGEKVVATPGGREATMVALNKMTGDVVWKGPVPEGDRAGYASCIAAEVDGQRQYIQFTASGVVAVAAKDGKFLWRYNAPANRTANCSTPIYRDHMVFAASGYATGGGAVKLATSNEGVTATEAYFTKQMQNHHGGMVLIGDYLYGFDGSNLTCLEFKTGDVKWSNRSVGKGAVAFAEGLLYCRSESGPMALVEATPTGYVEKARFSPPSDPNPHPDPDAKRTWPHPVVAGGRLYLRHMNLLLCYDIKQPQNGQ